MSESPNEFTVIDTDLPCSNCGTPMKCVLTGPESMPDIHGTYFCVNDDWRGECRPENDERKFHD